MDEFLERLERLEKIVENTIAKLDLHMAKKPKEVFVLTDPKQIKPKQMIGKKRELLVAIKKLQKSPHCYILINMLRELLDLKSFLNTENTEKKYNTEEVLNIFKSALLDMRYITELTEFVSQVAEFNLDLIKYPNVNPKHELEKFCTYYVNGLDNQRRPMYRKYSAWFLAFRTWCRKAEGFSRRPSYPAQHRDEVIRPDYEEREKRENGYEGGLLEVSDAYEAYEEEFLSR
jgi:hypothetical protein